MDLPLLDIIKRLALIAIVSDDYLMDRLVFKGGNALDLIYKVSGRASTDLDFSMSGDFDASELDRIRGVIEKNLVTAFKQKGFKVIDVNLIVKPPVIIEEYRSFWGGYKIIFKVIAENQIPKIKLRGTDQLIDGLRKHSISIGEGNKKSFEIDISKYEFCDGKKAESIEGYRIYVYTPTMIVLEKIRAICQQLPDYRAIISTNTPSPSRVMN